MSIRRHMYIYFYFFFLNKQINPPMTLSNPERRWLPQVYFEVRTCSNCTACLNGDWEHVAPPPLTHAICPGPSHSDSHTQVRCGAA